MSTEVEQVIAEMLRGAGLSDKPDEFDSNIHSWRCEHPDRYGRCKCFEETVIAIAAALRAANLLREPGDLRLPANATQQANQGAVDEEQIVATVLAELEEHRSTGDTGGWGTTFHRHGLSNEIHRGVDDCGRGTGKPVYVFDPDYLAEHDEWVVQATLRAAQGAAPQAPKDIHEPNHDRVYCVRCGGNWPCQPSPAPPSSGVDEDALAEVIGSLDWGYVVEGPSVREIAHAVSEWLKGQGL